MRRTFALLVAVALAAGCTFRRAPQVQPARGSLQPSLEQTDPQLREALLRLMVAPSAATHRRVAERYRALRVLDSALAHFDKALAFDRGDAAAHDGSARIWRDWGMTDRALSSASRAVFHAPDSAAARNTLGTILQGLGRSVAARDAYEMAIQLDPAAGYARNNLCYLSFLEGDLTAAADTCATASEVDPALRSARHNLALVYAAAGRPELARAIFLEAGTRADAHFNIGIVYMALEQYGRAAAAFEAATREEPSMQAAHERAKQARYLAGRGARPNTGDAK